MKNRILPLVLGAALLLPWLVPAAEQLGGPKPQPRRPVVPATDVQEFVFLGEARPVLIRLHVRADGKSLPAAWDDCIDYLFRYLDVNNDGVLMKDEVERVPTVDQLAGGALGRGLGGQGGRRGGNPAPAGPKLEDLDADGDGKVTRAELAAYYRKKGFAPFQFQFDSNQANPIGAFAAILGGPRSEPSVEAVSKAIFNLLDTNKDGKLSKEELEAAPAVLLRLDEDEDEVVTAQELVPDAGSNAGMLAGMLAMGQGGGRRETASSSPTLVPVLAPGEVPVDLVRRLLERYGKGGNSEGKKLGQKDLGLDEATFRLLDTNGDGLLDSQELASFVKREPDLELVLRLGKREKSEPRLEIVPKEGRPPLAGKCTLQDGLVLLNLGVTRAELRGNDQDGPDPIAGFARQQYLAQFRQADTDGNGILDANEIQQSRQFRNLVKLVDRNGDGKITEAELVAYLDHLQELQKRTRAGSVTLELSDQSRGLFDLLDTNRDGRLSVREMRGAPKLLGQLDRGGKGHLTREDIPRSYRLEVRRGPISQGGAGGINAIVSRYLTPYAKSEPEQAQRGPLWFRKMDRNRDGDVSRKEFLFGEELFRLIDTDGDGLISVEEAEKAEAILGTTKDRSER
jgi:Ca2+-binding EF-hand superfamily protein